MREANRIPGNEQSKDDVHVAIGIVGFQQAIHLIETFWANSDD